MLRRLTKPLITDCRYSTLAALNEICRQSREEQQQQEKEAEEQAVAVAVPGRAILKWKWKQQTTPSDALWR